MENYSDPAGVRRLLPYLNKGIKYKKNTPSGIRTPDPLIKSQLLYQLS